MSVALRPLRRQDGEQVRSWRNAPHVAAHMFTDHEVGEAEHTRWLDGVLGAPDRRLWIILHDETPVGLAHLLVDPGAGVGAWGFYLGETDVRGAGVGLAALYLLIQYAFGPAGLATLTCDALATNAAARRLYESMGFLRGPPSRAEVTKGGAPVAVCGFALSAAGWAATRPDVEQRLLARGLAPELLSVREG